MDRPPLRPPLRLFVAVALTLAVASGADPAAAHGDDGGAKNIVIALNRTDGAALSRSGVQVAPVPSGTAAPENLAVARSTCTGCRTVAVAVQAVLMPHSPSVATPRNAAVATNAGCSGCQTFASAYQCAVTTASSVTISGAGRERVAELHRDIAAVAASDVDLPTLDAELDQLVAQLWGVVDAELARAGEAGRCTPTEETATV